MTDKQTHTQISDLRGQVKICRISTMTVSMTDQIVLLGQFSLSFILQNGLREQILLDGPRQQCLLSRRALHPRHSRQHLFPLQCCQSHQVLSFCPMLSIDATLGQNCTLRTTSIGTTRTST